MLKTGSKQIELQSDVETLICCRGPRLNRKVIDILTRSAYRKGRYGPQRFGRISQDAKSLSQLRTVFYAVCASRVICFSFLPHLIQSEMHLGGGYVVTVFHQADGDDCCQVSYNYSLC